MTDETLKEQIKDILRMPHNKKPERFSIATQIRNEQLGLIMDLVKQDRERAVNAGRIEELEKLITLNKTLYGVEAEMTKRANNRLAKLSNPTQEKGKL
jgi:diacylglycerol kinase family enzyme